MKRCFSSRVARLACLTAAVSILLVTAFSIVRPDVQPSGVRLVGSSEQERHRAIAEHEGLRQSAATASRLAGEQAAELAQIQQWQKNRRADSHVIKGAK